MSAMKCIGLAILAAVIVAILAFASPIAVVVGGGLVLWLWVTA